jgi:signal transduction histidine kinase/DNA-binding response OmpR family regulator
MPSLRIVLLLVCSLSMAGLDAKSIPLRADSAAQTDLTRSVAYLIDETRQITIATAPRQTYQDAGSDILNFRFSPNAVWLRFTLQQPINQPRDYVLQLTNWYIDEADLYSLQPDGTFSLERAGDWLPLSKRAIKSRYPTFAIHLSNRQPQTFYLRITNTQYNNFALNLWPRALFYDMKLSGDSADFSLGLVAMRLFFHVALLMFLFSDLRFRAYSFFGISVCLIYFFSGGNGAILFPNSPTLANGMFFTTLSFIPATLSYYVFVVMEGKKYLPKSEPILWVFGGVGLLNLVANLFTHHAYLSWAFIFFMSLMLFGLLVILGLAFRNGARPSIWYLIPALLYIPPFCLYYARNAGLHNLPFTETGIRVIFLVEFLFVPVILAAMLRIIYRERLSIAKNLYLREAESDSLRQLDRAKTNFFTNVSHEFRTPLTLLIGPLTDLSQQFPANNLYAIMHRNARRLQTLTNELLDLAKVDAGQMPVVAQPGDVVADLRLWVASFESLAKSRGIALILNQNRPEQPARYDADKLEKIVTNLLSNALKFSGNGGQVRVDAQYQTTSLTLTVADTGIGIPPDALPHIFDRFYQRTTDAVTEWQRPDQTGTGVGLALVKELTQLLGGTITVASIVGEGTTFTLTLPLERTNEQPQTRWVERRLDSFSSPWPVETPATGVTEQANPSQQTILIVEDNDDLRAYIHQILADPSDRPNYTILEATDGQYGLETALDQLPDLVVCDVMMPRLDGFGLCQALRADVRTSHIPVVMLTALATQTDRLTGLKTGADDYLIKPFDRTELRIRVENLLTRQATLRQYWHKQLTQPTELRPANPTATIAPLDQPFLNTLYAFVEQHLDDSALDVNQLALVAAMSSRNLNRKLTALLGLTANDLIRTYRLRRAAELLRTGLSPTETAYQVGFDNPSYFSRVFREQHGKTPSEYAAEK